MTDRFDRSLVAGLRDAVEIELETEDERGSRHAATIRVVVAGAAHGGALAARIGLAVP